MPLWQAVRIIQTAWQGLENTICSNLSQFWCLQRIGTSWAERGVSLARIVVGKSKLLYSFCPGLLSECTVETLCWERKISGGGRGLLLDQVHHKPHFFLPVTNLHGRQHCTWWLECLNCNPRCFWISAMLVIIASEVPGSAKHFWPSLNPSESYLIGKAFLFFSGVYPLCKIVLDWK